MGKPRRSPDATTKEPLYDERASLDGATVSALEEHARAHERSKRRHAGLILRFFFNVMQKVRPRDRERIYYYVFHDKDLTAEDVAQVLRVLESKG